MSIEQLEARRDYLSREYDSLESAFQDSDCHADREGIWAEQSLTLQELREINLQLSYIQV